MSFKDLLAQPADSFKAPPPIPAGTYTGVIKGMSFGESRDKKTPYLRYTISLTGTEDPAIDQDELKDIEWGQREVSTDFYLTKDALFRLTDFLKSLGIKVEGNSLEAIIPDAIGIEVLVAISQRQNQKDPNKAPYSQVDDVKGLS